MGVLASILDMAVFCIGILSLITSDS